MSIEEVNPIACPECGDEIDPETKHECSFRCQICDESYPTLDEAEACEEEHADEEDSDDEDDDEDI